MKHAAVLFNPSSGKGRSIKQRTTVEHYLNQYGVNYDLQVTESENHLRQLAAETARDYELIIGVGGDTTFNIIAGEILKLENQNHAPALALIGTGSANDIARGLSIEKIADACKAIKQGNTGKMDIGRLDINGSPAPLFFLGTLSLGLGTTVNRYVESFHQRHNILSKIKPFDQLLSGLYAIHDSFKKKKVPLRVELEYRNQQQAEKIAGTIDFSLLVFLNTPYYANGLKLAEVEGALFDGLLDACIIDTVSFLHTLKVGIRIARGRQKKGDRTTLVRSGFFKVSSQEAIDIQVDGDIIEGVREFTVSAVPAALKVVIPA